LPTSLPSIKTPSIGHLEESYLTISSLIDQFNGMISKSHDSSLG
jgi:hypothetical protein